MKFGENVRKHRAEMERKEVFEVQRVRLRSVHDAPTICYIGKYSRNCRSWSFLYELALNEMGSA